MPPDPGPPDPGPPDPGPPDPGPRRVRLLSRPGCHLCDDARAVVRAVVGEAFEEVDVDSDPLLAARYGEEVPVVMVDGRQISYWTVEEARLRAALAPRSRWRAGS